MNKTTHGILLVLIFVLSVLGSCTLHTTITENSNFYTDNNTKTSYTNSNSNVVDTDNNSNVVDTGNNANIVTITVTKNFGSEMVLNQDIAFKTGTSAMAALQMVADVETEYGGGFISSINGISSEKNKDWFFYINGISSNLGAGDYVLKEGDVEQWDFHDWSYQQFVPAIIGSYPQPFLSGFKAGTMPTLVVYEAPFREEADSLAGSLKQTGVSQVSLISVDELSKKSQAQNNLIIIAGLQNGLISELNSLYKKLGFYAYSNSGKVVVLDDTGNLSNEYSRSCGLIQATQNPWNPNGVGAGESVVWMITGTDTGGVRDAVDVLINGRNELDYAFAAVISEGSIVKIP